MPVIAVALHTIVVWNEFTFFDIQRNQKGSTFRITFEISFQFHNWKRSFSLDIHFIIYIFFDKKKIEWNLSMI